MMNRISTTAVLFTALIFGCTFTGVSCAHKQAVASPEEAPATPAAAKEEGQVPDTKAPEDRAKEVATVREGDMEKSGEEKTLSQEKQGLEKTAAERDRFEGETIPFEFDSARLCDRAKELLREKAAWMAAHPGIFVTIEGHCDIRGTEPYNQTLGEERAVAVKSYLAGLGILPQRMTCVSFGEAQPLATGTQEADHQMNRRARFLIVPHPDELPAS
ncbi:MAG: OmpA family protein [Desulfobacter sp.]|nr:MAG: OmpA family protein [Desulfobacter sp.]